jgi:hypothetical protein
VLVDVFLLLDMLLLRAALWLAIILFVLIRPCVFIIFSEL